MKRIETIAAEFPNVGIQTSDQVLRGQLNSIGFHCVEAPADDADWLVVDGAQAELAARHPELPVLQISAKVSIYGLKQAIIALFSVKAA